MEFSEVYLKNKELVWNLASRYTALRQDKEDLFQEIFLRIYKALPGFKWQADIKTWIYRIAVNTAINYIKSQKRHKNIKEFFENFNILKGEQDKMPEPVEDISLWKPLNRLNPKQKMILLLAEVEEKPLAEVAQYMNMPIGTVKSSLSRAKEIVRKHLE